jgi:hypothetical protein
MGSTLARRLGARQSGGKNPLRGVGAVRTCPGVVLAIVERELPEDDSRVRAGAR